MVDRAREVDQGERFVVGVNIHKMPAEDDTLLRDIAEERIEPCYDIIDEVQAWRATRDMRRVVAFLDDLEAAGRNPSRNVTAAIVDALEADATMGECAGVLREAYGAPYDPLNGAERPR